jgi:hypothetical protein
VSTRVSPGGGYSILTGWWLHVPVRWAPISGPETSINCIAAPVRDASGREVAARSVSVSGPDIVMTDEQLTLLPSLLAVVEAISAVTT